VNGSNRIRDVVPLNLLQWKNVDNNVTLGGTLGFNFSKANKEGNNMKE
jgi:hypothetical protein